MKKLLTGVVIATAFAFPALSFADINLQSFGFKVNGLTSDSIQPGDDFEITVNADVNSGDEVEYFRIRLIDTDNNIVSTDCQSVGRVRDVNDKDIRFNTETPNDIPNGQYDVQLLPFGIPGEAQSNGCDLDNDYPGDQETYQNRLFVDNNGDIVGNSNSSSNSNSGGSSAAAPAWLSALLTQMNAQFTQLLAAMKPVAAPAPTKPAYCASMVQYNGMNAYAAQAWLLTTPHASGFHAAGVHTPTGYWGPISSSAYSAAMVACS